MLQISPRIINGLRSYIKHSKQYFLLFPNTLKLVKKKLGCASFFQPTSLCLEITENALPHVWSITWNTCIYNLSFRKVPINLVCKTFKLKKIWTTAFTCLWNRCHRCVSGSNVKGRPLTDRWSLHSRICAILIRTCLTHSQTVLILFLSPWSVILKLDLLKVGFLFW